MFDDQYHPIANVFWDLVAEGADCDLALVAQEAKRIAGIEEKTVTGLISHASPDLLVPHARALNKAWLSREHVKLLQGTIDKIIEGEDSELAIANYDTEKELVNELTQRKLDTRIEDILSSLDTIISANDAKGGLTGIPTGFPEIDNVTKGWQPGDFIILAARPGLGKTTLALDFALTAVERKVPTMVVSLEMTKAQIWKKFNSKKSDVSLSEMIDGNLSQEQIDHISTTFESMFDYPLLVHDVGDISNKWPAIRDKIAQAHMKLGIKLVVIDYVQLMTNYKSMGNRNLDVEEISRGVKNLALKLGISIIGLCQLSRDVEKRGGIKRPQMSDLRDSGSLEQDPDKIFFLYRNDYYGIEEDEEGNSVKGHADIYMPKHRNTGKLIKNLTLKYTDYNNSYKQLEIESLDSSSSEDYNPIIEPRGQRSDDEPIPF